MKNLSTVSIVATILFWVSSAIGAPEIFWIQLRTNLDFEDSLSSCTDRKHFDNQFDIVAEAVDGILTRVELRSPDYRYPTAFDLRYPENSPFFKDKNPAYKFPAVQVMPFTPEEIKGIKLYRDSGSRLWLKNLSLTPRLIVWLLNPVGLGCKPSLPQTKALPEIAAFSFELEGVKAGIPISYSELVPLTLYRWDGKQYHTSTRADLRLQQLERKPSMSGGYAYSR